ncbi:MAG TPA: bifunctional metallophosphatase/5'-nucleotidase, partial [Accumulibacter sp.]|nr:bifunctional metallophosphatase/5'-nucleotidase [Accumulibacter sp.]
MRFMLSLRLLTNALFLILTLALSACQTPPLDVARSANGHEVHIAHINDHHSNLEAHANFEISLDGVATRVTLGGFPRLTTLFRQYSSLPNLLKIHAGDAMTGTLY